MIETMSLLLVDDNAIDADLLRYNLDSIPNLNLQFEWVNEFQTGLEMVCENRHDICMVDQFLGPRTGADLIRQALQRGCRRPMILYSGKEDVGLGLQAIGLGAVDYIVKDHIDPFMLEKTLRGVLERERILQENARVQAKMYDAQRLESLGLMASGIAHDFNNILGIILANSELAMGLTADQTVNRYLGSIKLATERAAELTNQMLAYSGRGKARQKTLDLSSLASDTLEFCRVGIPRRVSMHCEISQRPPPVRGDPTQVRQVLMNLIQNASDSIVGNGKVTIQCQTARPTDFGIDALQFVTPIAEGDYAVLKVSDDGCGMSQEQTERIFDPFFTTKATGRGLGLAAVLGIVKAHKGSLRVKSTRGEGTTFEVWFPLSGDSWDDEDEDAESLETSTPNQTPETHHTENPTREKQGGSLSGAANTEKTKPLGGAGSGGASPAATSAGQGSHSGYVLVVDDEPAILQALEVMLQARGYHTRAACDAEEALEGASAECSAAVIDVMLAGRTGVELFRDLRAMTPDLPVVFISGYNESEALLPLVRNGEVQYLRKPFSSTQLMDALETAYRDRRQTA